VPVQLDIHCAHAAVVGNRANPLFRGLCLHPHHSRPLVQGRASGERLASACAPVLLDAIACRSSNLSRRAERRHAARERTRPCRRAELKAAIDEWIEHRNQDPKPFTWTATAKTILVKHHRAKKVLAKAGCK
jgi:hypothetical protein